MLNISIAAEKIFDLWGISVTNSLIFSLIIMFFLVILAAWIGFRTVSVPNRLQSVAELVIGYMYDMVEGISGPKVREFFPLIATLFIFVLMSNWLGLIPGIGGFGLEHVDHGKTVVVPFLRSPSADLNTTFALALIAVGATQYYGIKYLGVFKHIGKYLNFKSPIDFFVGILELISEFSRILSFSFRLFGNIFAGEVMLLVLGSLVPLFVPIPFLALEVFVGLVQAFVFAVLTAVLIQLAVETSH